MFVGGLVLGIVYCRTLLKQALKFSEDPRSGLLTHTHTHTERERERERGKERVN